MDNFFEISNLKLEKEKVKVGEKIRLFISFVLNGGIRKVFNPDVWDEAYKKGERKFLLKYLVKIKLKKGIFSKEILKEKVIRKAVFFWTRNPTIDRRIWVLLVYEDMQPKLITSLEEIHEDFFKFEKFYELDTRLLGKGRHTIQAEVRAKWSNYTFIKASQVKASSNIVEIECIE